MGNQEMNSGTDSNTAHGAYLQSPHLFDWGFAFLLISVPLVPYRYFPDFGPPLVMLGVRYAPVGVCLLIGALWGWSRRGKLSETLGELPLGWPVMALMLTGLVSSLGAERPLVSAAKMAYYFLTGGLLYLVVVDQVRDGQRAWRLLYCFLGAAYLGALYALLEFVLGGNGLYGGFFTPENEAYRRLIPDPWFGRRVVGTVGHPVVLGSYLVLALPVSLAAAMSAGKKGVQVALLGGSLCVLAALLLTFTRGAWLAGVVAIGVFLKLRGIRHLLLLPVVLGVLGVAAMSFSGVSEVAVERVQDAYRNYALNFGRTQRGAAYGHVALMAQQHPVAGLGTGMYRFAAYELRRQVDIPTPLGVLDTPDNMFLMWLAENGAMGLVAAVYVLVALFALLWRAGKRAEEPGRRVMAWGFIAAFAGLCVDMLTVDALYFHVTRAVFWMVAGLAVALLGCVDGDGAD